MLLIKKLCLFQAWITLGRAQLNFGEPDAAIESFDRALAIKVKSINTLSVPVFSFQPWGLSLIGKQT